MPRYSIVIPLHNEQENVTDLYDRLKAVMETNGESFEIVFVDDGSSDDSFPLLRQIRRRGQLRKGFAETLKSLPPPNVRILRHTVKRIAYFAASEELTKRSIELISVSTARSPGPSAMRRTPLMTTATYLLTPSLHPEAMYSKSTQSPLREPMQRPTPP